jgi:pyrimidine-nucleoside phosphorylase
MFDPVAVIRRKRDGQPLADAEIAAFVAAYTAGEVADEQAAALCMAVFFQGMDDRETGALTRALVASGRTLDLGGIPGTKVDKHSTGGVGDKTSLVLVPLLAAAGFPVAKLSGRGLGHTGGTLDKLESIPGVRVDLDERRFLAQVRHVGCAIAGQGPELVPADGRLYALRDLTATIESPALIAASVMSKKIAGGADTIVLDVKVGAGAFMRTREQARDLARRMLAIGRGAGRRVAAVLSDMSQPLGRAVGNAVEVAEAVATLRGHGPADLVELCLTLGAQAGADRARLASHLRDGSAYDRLVAMLEAQGGEPGALDRLPEAPFRTDVPAPASGFVAELDALAVGRAVAELGAGRRRKGDAVDPAVGVILHKKRGDAVRAGEPLATVLARRDGAGVAAVLAAYRVAEEPPAPLPLVLEVL